MNTMNAAQHWQHLHSLPLVHAHPAARDASACQRLTPLGERRLPAPSTPLGACMLQAVAAQRRAAVSCGRH